MRCRLICYLNMLFLEDIQASNYNFRFLVLVTIVNTALSLLLYFYFKTEFPSVLLFILLGNLGMYLTFYLWMKTKTKEERLTVPAMIFLILNGLCMLPALYFFFWKVKDTGAGTALSKEMNQPCLEGLNYFDNHDLWHFLSRYNR